MSTPTGDASARRDRALEADRLCALIAEHAEALAEAHFGRRFQLGKVSFRVRRTGRNTVYRVSGLFEWFLKLPRGRYGSSMLREQIGAENIHRALVGADDYCPVALSRVSREPGYVLASAIPGTPLNRVLTTQVWLPGRTAAVHLERCFQNLGVLLAKFHAAACLAADTPRATTDPFAALAKLLERVQKPDSTVAAIRSWSERPKRVSAATGFIHGNFRLDNVLAANAQLGFIDLENSGAGQFCLDLSRPVSELLLTQCLWLFPRQRTSRFLNAFLKAYASQRSYDPVELHEFVRARIARYYVETCALKVMSGRVGGIPVAASRLRELTDVLMETQILDSAKSAYPMILKPRGANGTVGPV